MCVRERADRPGTKERRGNLPVVERLPGARKDGGGTSRFNERGSRTRNDVTQPRMRLLNVVERRSPDSKAKASFIPTCANQRVSARLMKEDKSTQRSIRDCPATASGRVPFAISRIPLPRGEGERKIQTRSRIMTGGENDPTFGSEIAGRKRFQLNRKTDRVKRRFAAEGARAYDFRKLKHPFSLLSCSRARAREDGVYRGLCRETRTRAFLGRYRGNRCERWSSHVKVHRGRRRTSNGHFCVSWVNGAF